jgi:hypothetical protein
MRRLSFIGFAAFAAAAAVLFVGCQKSSVINLPPGPAPQLFVANPAFVSGTFGVAVYAQPITPSSTPVFTLGAANGITLFPAAVGFDTHGNLFVLDESTSQVLIYAPPISSSSTPATTLALAGASNAFSLAVDAGNNLWVSSSNNATVWKFTPPFATGTPAPALTLTALNTVPAISRPAAIGFDRYGDMCLEDFGTNQVLIYRPPFAVPITAAAAIRTNGGADEPGGCGFNVNGQLLVSDFTNGNEYFYNPPFATGSLPAFAISPPVVSGGLSGGTKVVGFDSAGNLYVPYSFDGANGNVSVYGPPFSGASVPQFSLPQSGDPYGVGFSP